MFLFQYLESIKVISALLSYFSILPADALLDKNGLVRFALQVRMIFSPLLMIFLSILVLDEYSCSSPTLCFQITFDIGATHRFGRITSNFDHREIAASDRSRRCSSSGRSVENDRKKKFYYFIDFVFNAFFSEVELFKCQVGLDSTSYTSFLDCLQDYYPEVRLAACEALYLLAIHSPEKFETTRCSTSNAFDFYFFFQFNFIENFA